MINLMNHTNKEFFKIYHHWFTLYEIHYQVWCGDYRKQRLIERIKNNAHSPGKYRVIGAVSNSEDFAKAYKCKAGAPMNPEKKCSVW